ncbi:MAG: hypothetical protein ACRD68_15955, partial [Pyrinomonadaceae bacterium]
LKGRTVTRPGFKRLPEDMRAAIVLFLQNRLAPLTLGFGIVDLILGALFVVAYLRTLNVQGRQ